MPLTSAEKTRRYREKLKQNPEKLEQVRIKNLERIKSKYKYKKISEMTETEKKAQRQKWKAEKKKQNDKKRSTNKANSATSSSAEAPGSSASVELSNVPDNTLKLTKAVSTIRKSRDQLKRQLNDAECRIAFLQRSYETARKKIYRLQQSLVTERKKFETDILKMTARNEVLEASLKQTYKNCANNKERDLIKGIIHNDVVINNKAKTFVSQQINARLRKKRTAAIRMSKLKTSIIEFYMRDDISRATAGKRECRTQKKNKQQIRYLNNSLRALHEIYKKEGGTASFATFCRFKPFFILSPSIQNRNTCLCIKHSNMAFKIAALFRHKIIDFPNTRSLLEKIACDSESYDCMYGHCDTCRGMKINYNNLDESGNKSVNWEMWESVTHTYKKKTPGGAEKDINTKKTTKTTKTSTVSELIQLFEADIAAFKIHSFNASHQIKCYNYCIENLSDGEMAIHCDFSQNYECKMSEEVQSMHFGASKGQVTLHTGVLFYKGGQKSFCTVSHSNEHQPHAIWAHLEPIIDLGKALVNNLKRIHIFSDGPTSQYRQKNNFFLTNYFSTLHNVEITWSFFESSHGKGVADAIGGVVKRFLDRQVCYGKDIINAADVYSTLQSSLKTVHISNITEEKIDDVKKLIPDNVETISGTMKIHQIIYAPRSSQIKHRILSCFCSETKTSCSCYGSTVHTIKNVLNLLPDPGSNEPREAARIENSEVTNGNEESIFQEVVQCQVTTDEIQIIDPNAKIDEDESEFDIFNMPIILQRDSLPQQADERNVKEDIESFNAEDNKENKTIISQIESSGTFKTYPRISKNRLDLGTTSGNTKGNRQILNKKSLTCVVSRKVTCNKCESPVPMQNIVKCVACKKKYCSVCTGGVSYSEYICDTCFED